MMSTFEMSQFKTLNHSSRDEVDNDAVIKGAQQNYEDVDLPYDFTPPEEDRYFPLYQAIKLGLPYNVIGALSGHLALKQKTYYLTHLHYAIQCNASFEVVELLLNKCPDAARTEGLTPLHKACQYGTLVEVVRKLLEIWPNAVRVTSELFCWTPLHWAIRSNASIDV
eukprot:5260134-Ditylum_brightwellii.AAC.1